MSKNQQVASDDRRGEDGEARAALAVAPATAQPVAWVVMGKRGLTRRSPPYLSREEAERCVMELDRGEFLEDLAQTPHRVVPLYAARPATGDAAAVREAARRAMGECGVDRQVFDVLWDAKVAPLLRALPLPAPATAVEEARKALIEKAKRWRENARMGGNGDGKYFTIFRKEDEEALWDAASTLFAAEAAATPKGEARGGARG